MGIATANPAGAASLKFITKQMATSLSYYASDVISQSNSIIIKISELETIETRLIDNIEQYKTSVVGYKDDMKDFFAKVNGVTDSLNCRFLKSNLQRLQIQFCDSFVSAMFLFSFFCGIVGC